MNIFERLKEERVRLGFNQTDFALLGGVQKLAQINYESGKRNPDSAYLAAIASVGADVNYILTGVRVTAIDPIDRTVQITVELFNGMTKKQREVTLSLLSIEKQQSDEVAEKKHPG